MGHHHHGSGHHHDHSHTNKKVLFWAFFLTMLFAVLEIVYSFISSSLALLSEGTHMASDGISLLLGFLAVTFGLKLATSSKTFGYKRFETIAAFVNGLTLMLIPVLVFIEAIRRLFEPQEVMGMTMLWVAIIGLVINLIVAFILSTGDKNNLNLRAAMLHVLADLFSSVSTIIAALCVMYFEWYFVDPLVSVIVSIVIFVGGWKITKEAFHILMEGVPEDKNLENLKGELLKFPFVKEIEELKLWSLNGEDCHGIIKLFVDDWDKYEEHLATLEHFFHSSDIQCTIQCKKSNS